MDVANGYVIEEVGKPPDLVMEVASASTGRNDYTEKRITYADLAVPEYWRFDYTGGAYHDAPLAGDRLSETGVYRADRDGHGAGRGDLGLQRGLGAIAMLDRGEATLLGSGAGAISARLAGIRSPRRCRGPSPRRMLKPVPPSNPPAPT